MVDYSISRAHRLLQVAEDLRFGGTDDDPNALFYRALDVAVDPDGNIYVYDAGNFRIQVFDPSGSYLRTIGGRTGQGPGEFALGGQIAADHSHIVYVTDNRLTIWTLEGKHIATRTFLESPFIRDIATLAGSHLVASYDEGNTPNRTIALLGMDGSLLRRFATLATSGDVAFRSADHFVNTGLQGAQAGFATNNSTVYVTRGDEYEVLAISADGRPQWVLDVEWPRLPVEEKDVAAGLARVRQRVAAARRSDIDWPTAFPALSIPVRLTELIGRRHPLRVDGQGNLYVFPFIRADRFTPLTRVAVDVYSPAGELLFSGAIPEISWLATRGDYVYGLETNPRTGEQEVVRYYLSGTLLQ